MFFFSYYMASSSFFFLFVNKCFCILPPIISKNDRDSSINDNCYTSSWSASLFISKESVNIFVNRILLDNVFKKCQMTIFNECVLAKLCMKLCKIVVLFSKLFCIILFPSMGGKPVNKEVGLLLTLIINFHQNLYFFYLKSDCYLECNKVLFLFFLILLYIFLFILFILSISVPFILLIIVKKNIYFFFTIM